MVYNITYSKKKNSLEFRSNLVKRNAICTSNCILLYMQVKIIIESKI